MLFEDINHWRCVPLYFEKTSQFEIRDCLRLLKKVLIPHLNFFRVFLFFVTAAPTDSTEDGLYTKKIEMLV